MSAYVNSNLPGKVIACRLTTGPMRPGRAYRRCTWRATRERRLSDATVSFVEATIGRRSIGRCSAPTVRYGPWRSLPAAGLHGRRSFDWLVVTIEDSAHFQGVASIDGSAGVYAFRVDVYDTSNPGGSDRFLVRIWDIGADPTQDSPLYQASGDLAGGKIQIHG